MDAIRVPVSNTTCIEKATRLLTKAQTPFTIWGASRNVRPLVMEALRGDAEQVLLVTYDEARADQLYQDYRFYDRNVYIYPAKDVLFYYADVHGNLAARKRLEIIKRIQDKEVSKYFYEVNSPTEASSFSVGSRFYVASRPDKNGEPELKKPLRQLFRIVPEQEEEAPLAGKSGKGKDKRKVMNPEEIID